MALPPERPCQGGCGTSLAGRRSDAKWCGNSCRTRAYKARDRPRYLANKSAWHASRGRWLRHGLDPDKAIKMLASGCAICQAPFTRPEDAKVDHDHAHCPGQTGCAVCVRALLCNGCNATIGFAEEDADRLRRAAAYIEEHRS